MTPAPGTDRRSVLAEMCEKLTTEVLIIGLSLVLMVEKVVFGDGTADSAETTSEALGEFFEKEKP